MLEKPKDFGHGFPMECAKKITRMHQMLLEDHQDRLRKYPQATIQRIKRFEPCGCNIITYTFNDGVYKFNF